MPVNENDLSKKRLNNREVRFGDWIFRREEQPNPDEEKDPCYHITGRAVVFDSPTVLYPKEMTGLDYDIREVIDKDAFKDCDFSNAILNINHGDGNHAYAKVKTNSLHITVNDKGVDITADLPKDNRRCEDFYKDVRDGLLDKMSFAFIIKKQAYDRDEHMYHIEAVSKVYDVSAVDHPAYDETSISASRSRDLVELKEDLVRSEKIAEMRKSIHDIYDEMEGNGGCL